jgi:CRISPR/Cas system-associated exonuclease Cas4 (RecB family)
LSDFKTARSGWSDDHVLDAAPQLLIYSEVAQDLADGRPIQLQFAVMNKAKIPFLAIHPVLRDADRLERTKRIVERVWNAIQAGHFYPSPSPINCTTCPFRRPCRAWQA